MQPVIERVRAQLKQILNGFTPGQKAVTGIAVLFVLVGGYVFTSWAGKPSYSPLFSGLQASDAQAVTDALTTKGTPFKLANGGTTIMVPANKVYESRIALSATGLPTGGTVGWGILDKQGITASEFTQRVDFQRALEGELDKTITSMDGVQGATVHLVIPKEDLFTADQQKATAGVLLKLRPDVTMSATQVQSIVHLVASAVEGLTSDNVSVTDSAGNLLSAPGQDGAALAAGDFRAQQTAAYEHKIADTVKSLLTSLVGPNGADVRVNAELNYDDNQVTQEQFQANNAPAVQTTKNSETFTGTNQAAGGALGQTQTTVPGGNSNYVKTQEQSTQPVDKTTTTNKTAPGKVVRQSVAVILDRKKSASLNIATIQAQVAAAAGIVQTRGDTVSVARAPFDTTVQNQQAKALKDANASKRLKTLMDGLKSVGTLLLVGLGLLFGYRRLRGTPVEETIPLEHLALQAGEGELLELDEEDIVELEPSRHQVTIDGDDDPTTVLVSRRHRRELDRLPGLEERMAENADIADLIDRQPDDVAQLLRGWMSERR
jgi:flagellar M-ring protein FliF